MDLRTPGGGSRDLACGGAGGAGLSMVVVDERTVTARWEDGGPSLTTEGRRFVPKTRGTVGFE